jgi:dihydrodiol dehydrogenase / D-xylose 1-dehydrogenase (NADP)
LTVNPETRDVKDIKHEILAAASSSSADRASEFLKKVGAPSSARGYGSYEELVADKNVDIIYVATPHSHHYQNAMLCLEAGKNVLCEKAFTVNAAQAKKLAEKAKEKNLFLMEAVWTRYFPLSIYVREIITSGKVYASVIPYWVQTLTYPDRHSPTHFRRPLYRHPARRCLR